MQTQKVIDLGRNRATPHITAQKTDEGELPAKYANHQFFYVCYPTGWEFSLQHGFLPVLNEVSLTPGLNGVPLNGDSSRAVAGSLAKGGTVIRDNDPALRDWQNYLVSYPCQGGGKHYCFKAAEYSVLPGGRVRETDYSEALTAFRLHLRDSGLVPPMHPSVYLLLLDVEHKGLERLRKEAAALRRRPEDVAAKEARIAAMIACWDGPQPSQPSVPDAAVPAAVSLKPKREKAPINTSSLHGQPQPEAP